MPTTTSTAHLDTAIGPDLHAMHERAAGVRGVTSSNFVVAAVQEAA